LDRLDVQETPDPQVHLEILEIEDLMDPKEPQATQDLQEVFQPVLLDPSAHIQVQQETLDPQDRLD
jgi:hypothetical protein